MFVVIVGGGKVGLNLTRSLTLMGHEAILVEQRKFRYDLLVEELQEKLLLGDGTEIWVLERAGIARADLVVAVTGDDEDNLIISQVAKRKYGVKKVVARVNNPRNQATFDVLGVEPTICATTNILALVRRELPEHKLVHLLTLKRENLEIVELEVGEHSPVAGKLVEEISLPEGALLTAILRNGSAQVARLKATIEPGDYVLCLVEPGKEKDLIHEMLPDESPEKVQAEGEPEYLGGE
jgi:trk system potassium uptake protein TrkA